MVDYVAALKRPFSDLKSFVIAAILALIPILNLAFTGYVLECAVTASKKDYKLPEWKDWGRLFIRGLIQLIISFIYFIPVAAVGIVLVVFGMALRNAILSLLGLLVFFAVMLVVYLMLPMALVSYAIHDDIKAAFTKEVIRKVFTKKYIVAWIIVFVISSVIAAVLALLPMVAVAIISIFSITVFATLYPEL